MEESYSRFSILWHRENVNKPDESDICLWLCSTLRGFPVSVLGPEASYLDFGLSWFHSALHKCARTIFLNRPRPAPLTSYPILHSLPFCYSGKWLCRAEFFWEADSRLAGQDFHKLLWNPKGHYCVRKYTILVLILSQMNPVHPFQLCFLKINFNTLLPSTPMSLNWSLPFRFPS
jgi:hypothetical protein